MAMSAAERLSIFLPQYIGDPSIPGYLAMAEEQTAPASEDGWDAAQRATAVALRAAHNITLDRDITRAGGTAGAVSSKKEGSLAVSFSNGGGSSSSGMDDLDQTSFGLRLKRLIRANFLDMHVSGGDGTLDTSYAPYTPGGFYDGQ